MSRLEAALPQLAMVEDEADFRECAIDYLHMSGYSAWGAGCGEDFYRRLLVDPVDILILDVGLPGESGFEIASHLRSSRPDIGIIILSARDQVGDRLQGLGNGADCYLVKPVDFQELIANIDAVWRRVRAFRHVPQDGVKGILAESWTLDQEGWQLASPEGRQVGLTSKEFLLLRALFAAHGETVSKPAVVEALGGNPEAFDYHRIDVLLSRLRKKWRAATGTELPVRTVQSAGYAFTAAGTFC